MDPTLLQLHIDIAVLKSQLATALKDKDVAERSLLHVLRTLSQSSVQPLNALNATSETTSLQSHGDDQSVAKKPQSSVTSRTERVSALENDLLDGPPQLDLAIRGITTSHDAHIEPLLPIGASTNSGSAFAQTSSTEPYSFNSSQGYTEPPLPRNAPRKQDRGHRSFNPLAGSYESRIPSFYVYGIRYTLQNPSPRTFHRIVITGLPPGTSLSSLLSKVHGGTIVDCQLMDLRGLVQSMSALIRLKDEVEALGIASQSFMEISSQKARITLIETPSYPLSDRLHYNVFFNGYTRCLKIEKYTETYSERIPMEHLRSKFMAKLAIVHMDLDSEGQLIVHFTSIQLASDAYDYLIFDRSLPKSHVAFLPDPCAEPLESSEGVAVQAKENHTEGPSSGEEHQQTPSGNSTASNDH